MEDAARYGHRHRRISGAFSLPEALVALALWLVCLCFTADVCRILVRAVRREGTRTRRFMHAFELMEKAGRLIERTGRIRFAGCRRRGRRRTRNLELVLRGGERWRIGRGRRGGGVELRRLREGAGRGAMRCAGRFMMFVSRVEGGRIATRVRYRLEIDGMLLCGTAACRAVLEEPEKRAEERRTPCSN